MVSIITVSANEHERLEKTLNSFARLDPSFEIVLVIPATDHEASQTIQAYEDRIRAKIIVVNDNHEGIYPAMNLGIVNSSGLFSIFLNAGDEVSSSFDIEDFSHALRNVSENWVILYPTLSWDIQHVNHVNQVADFFKQSNEFFISHQAVLFRTSLLRKFGGYNPRYKVIGDTALMYQFFEQGEPNMSDFNFSIVEAPNFASINQRKSRVEFLVLILTTYQWDIKLIAARNFIKREASYLNRRIRSDNEI